VISSHTELSEHCRLYTNITKHCPILSFHTVVDQTLNHSLTSHKCRQTQSLIITQMSSNAEPFSLTSHTNVDKHCPILPHPTQMSTNTVPLSLISHKCRQTLNYSLISHPKCRQKLSHYPHLTQMSSNAEPFSLIPSPTALPTSPASVPTVSQPTVSPHCQPAPPSVPSTHPALRTLSSHTNVDKHCPTLSHPPLHRQSVRSPTLSHPVNQHSLIPHCTVNRSPLSASSTVSPHRSQFHRQSPITRTQPCVLRPPPHPRNIRVRDQGPRGPPGAPPPPPRARLPQHTRP
jgi:hypothetical protein